MGKYQLIVIDPPWEIEKIKKEVRPNQVEMDYPMMSLAQIRSIPMREIADPNNCICFMWTIDKYLYEARPILEAWGFHYHRTMSWDKTNGLAMYGFNYQTEFVLVGFMGKQDAYPERKTIRTSFSAKSEYHSAKPDLFYEMLDVLPHNPRLDMFARQERTGLFMKNKWDIWGNHLKSDIKLEVE